MLVGWLVGGTMNWKGTEKMSESQVNVDLECNDHHAPVTPTSALCIPEQWSCPLWQVCTFPKSSGTIVVAIRLYIACTSKLILRS